MGHNDIVATPSHEDSSFKWFARGLLVGVLVLGSLNALSFFFRSQGWGSLLGDRNPRDEAIGFPLLIWQEASGYGSHTLKLWAFGFDILFGLLIGSAIGMLAVLNKARLNQISRRFQAQSNKQHLKMQFSMRGLMICAVLAATASAIARVFTPRVEILAAIYALGPLALVLISFLPRNLRWQQRVAMITPLTFMLIAVAITLANAIGVEFDKVLMGIFICWTPQTAFAAIALTGLLLYRENRKLTDTAVG